MMQGEMKKVRFTFSTGQHLFDFAMENVCTRVVPVDELKDSDEVISSGTLHVHHEGYDLDINIFEAISSVKGFIELLNNAVMAVDKEAPE